MLHAPTSNAVDVVLGAPQSFNEMQNNWLNTGQETLWRPFVSGSGVGQVASNVLALTFFTARRTESTSQIRDRSGGTAAQATPTLCRLGLYSVNSNGDGTLIASIANDTTLYASANTAYTRSWTTQALVVQGQRYAVGRLVVSGGTMPSFLGLNTTQADLGVAPRITGALNGQSDLPASFADASLASATNLSATYSVILAG